MDHFTSPRNILTVPEEEFGASGVGMVGNPSCGDMMKIWIKIDADENITDLKWKTFWLRFCDQLYFNVVGHGHGK